MADKIIQKEEMDFENIKEEDIKGEVEFTFSKKAFESENIYCYKCKKKTKKVGIEMSLPNNYLSVRLNVFRCSICNKDYLNFEEAGKLDKLLVLSSLIEKKGVGYKRSLNFDGDNIFIRFPNELTKGVNKNSKADIIPISMDEFLVRLEK